MKTDIEILAADPVLRERFAVGMMSRATAIGLDEEIGKRVVEIRATMTLLRAHGMHTQEMALYYSHRLPFHILMSARAVGAERGVRVGAEVAERFVADAQQFAINVIASDAPWLLTDDDW